MGWGAMAAMWAVTAEEAAVVVASSSLRLHSRRMHHTGNARYCTLDRTSHHSGRRSHTMGLAAARAPRCSA